MTIKAIIILTNPKSMYHDTYIAIDGGVSVGPTGELRLVADTDAIPQEFRIYAPGVWQEVNVSPVIEE